MLRRFALVTAPLLVVAAACSTVQVARDYDTRADFSRYQTFAVRPGVVTGAFDGKDNPLIAERVERALRRTLIAKGLKEDPEDPDLVVTYVGGARDLRELEAAAPQVYEPFGFVGWGPSGWWQPGEARFYTRDFREGTLVVDLIDAETQRPVWRGYVSDELGPGELSGERGEGRILDAVKKLFAPFPP